MNFNAILKLLVATACVLCVTACTVQEGAGSTTEPVTKSVAEGSPTAVEEYTEEITTDIVDKYECREIVDNRWWDLCKTLKYKVASNKKQAEMTVELLEELVDEGYVEPDSIIVGSSYFDISFRYAYGGDGHFVLKKLDSRCN